MGLKDCTTWACSAWRMCGGLGLVLLLEIPLLSFDPATDVYPPHSMVHERPLADWGRLWWQWGAGGPVSVNAILDQDGTNCHNGEAREVVFLAGSFGQDSTKPPIERRCTIPGGREILFPLLNQLCIVTRPGRPPKTCSELMADCVAAIDQASSLECTVDGVPIPDLFDHREASPECFDFYMPPDNLAANSPSRWYEPATQEGYWVMLKPLPTGEHEIHIRGEKTNPPFLVDIVYKLTVLPDDPRTNLFRRGDANDDGQSDLSDAVAILGGLFQGTGSPRCSDAADVDDNGGVDISDAVNLLNYLFRGGPAPPWPSPVDIGCAADPTPDGLLECAGNC